MAPSPRSEIAWPSLAGTAECWLSPKRGRRFWKQSLSVETNSTAISTRLRSTGVGLWPSSKKRILECTCFSHTGAKRSHTAPTVRIFTLTSSRRHAVDSRALCVPSGMHGALYFDKILNNDYYLHRRVVEGESWAGRVGGDTRAR